jgi:mannose-1-phosphate guanylyltransferase/phosphomannomutase
MPSIGTGAFFLKAAIIAGGKGTRIRELTNDTIPKALLSVAGVPIIYRQLQLLARYGVKQVAMLTGHLADVFEERVPEEATRLGMEVSFFKEKQPLGSAGGFTAARDFFDGNFLVMYCDVAIEMDLERLMAFHESRNSDVTIVCHPNDHPYESDLVLADEEFRVERVIYKKNREPGFYPNLVPAGVYCFSKKVFEYTVPGAKQDFIMDVFPRMIEKGADVYVYRTPEYLRDMGTYERFKMVEDDITTGRMFRMNFSHKRPAIFFDRDGVLAIHDHGTDILDAKDFELIPHAAKAVKLANDAGFLCIVVTNQPMIAKGFMSFPDLKMIHAKMETLLGMEHAKLDMTYYCPHHPEKGFKNEIPGLKIDCECRKPKPGMLKKASAELPVALEDSCVIGDSFRDVGAARAMGIDVYGVRTGEGSHDCVGEYRPDLVFDDVLGAVTYAIDGINEAAPVARKIASGLREKVPYITGVCGVARAGKSSFCHSLAKALTKLGIRVMHVRLDDWIVPRSLRTQSMPSEERSQTGLYPDFFARIIRGERVETAGYEQVTRESSKAVSYQFAGEQVILFDGLYACHASIREKLDLSVFVDADEEVLEHRFESFYRWKGESDESIASLLAERKKEEWPMVSVQRTNCDIIWTVTRQH